ncbi:MAG: hypothetical protein ACR2PT_05670 [Endozoicomonas sp.]
MNTYLALISDNSAALIDDAALAGRILRLAAGEPKPTINPLVWSQSEQKYLPMSEDQLKKIDYEKVRIDSPDSAEGKKYIKLLGEWQDRFKYYIDNKKTDQMAKVIAENGEWVASSLKEKLLTADPYTFYVLSTTNGKGEKVPLAINASKSLYMAYEISYPDSQIEREARPDGTIGRLGESVRIRALTGLVERAKENGAAGESRSSSIRVTAISERNAIYERYGFKKVCQF